MSQTALEASVLVLNRFYMPIRVVNVRRAMTLLYRDCAEVIGHGESQYVSYDFESWCEYSQLVACDRQPGEDYIRAVDFDLQVPRIVRLTRFDRMPQQSVRFSRKNLFARDDYQCQYCGKRVPAQRLSIDHVIPRSHGGPTTWENVVACCLRCNSHKGGRTPQQARMSLLRHPAHPRVNPLLAQSIRDPRYECWKTFIHAAG